MPVLTNLQLVIVAIFDHLANSEQASEVPKINRDKDEENTPHGRVVLSLLGTMTSTHTHTRRNQEMRTIVNDDETILNDENSCLTNLELVIVAIFNHLHAARQLRTGHRNAENALCLESSCVLNRSTKRVDNHGQGGCTNGKTKGRRKQCLTYKDTVQSESTTPSTSVSVVTFTNTTKYYAHTH